MGAQFSRKLVAKGVSLGIGILSAMALQSALVEKEDRTQPPRPQKVRVTTRVEPPAVAPAVPVQKPEAILPLKTDKSSSRKSTPDKQQVKTEPTIEEPSPPVESLVEVIRDLPTLTQPQLPGQEPAPTDIPMTLPRIDTAKLPPMPGERLDMPVFALASVEEPGKEILVLGLLVNDRGIVEDTAIAVPSKHALEDLTFALAYKGKTWTQIEPPLMVGERRWLELRIDYEVLNNNSLLP
ncbi:hypothetical protein LC612_30465 [Nostoc sp. CHAB 5834]|nr:hypothetical protein [Nostoc sp. CHAB 5834]